MQMLEGRVSCRWEVSETKMGNHAFFFFFKYIKLGSDLL